MVLNSIKSYQKQEKKAIGVGVGCYLISVFLVLVSVIILINLSSLAFTGEFLINVFLVEVLFSLPAIPSSLVATYISKKRNTGIYTVGISGGIMIVLLTMIILMILQLLILQPPPTSHYEEFSRGMVVFLIPLLYPFLIFPIAAMSAILAVLVERSYFYFHPTWKAS